MNHIHLSEFELLRNNVTTLPYLNLIYTSFFKIVNKTSKILKLSPKCLKNVNNNIFVPPNTNPNFFNSHLLNTKIRVCKIATPNFITRYYV